MFEILRKSTFSADSLPTAAIAIPAQNESESIEVCLEALARQTVREFAVVVFCNNCVDDTYLRAHNVFETSRIKGIVVDAIMSPASANAGGARRAAMDLAHSLLRRSSDLLLTTDADSTPGADWIARNTKAIKLGAEGVAGMIAIHPDDDLPPILKSRGELESTYEELLTEIFARIDPIAWDPWPRHVSEPGASLAVTYAAYLQIGGLPAIAFGEDRALIKALECAGLRVRHDPTISVTTSGRLIGRAQGGVADTLRFRIAQPDAECDSYLEPAFVALRRAQWRKRCRDRHSVPGRENRRAFAMSWERIEAAEPLLTRVSIRPSELPEQIKIARAIVKRLRSVALKSVGASPCGTLQRDAEILPLKSQPIL